MTDRMNANSSQWQWIIFAHREHRWMNEIATRKCNWTIKEFCLSTIWRHNCIIHRHLGTLSLSVQLADWMRRRTEKNLMRNRYIFIQFSNNSLNDSKQQPTEGTIILFSSKWMWAHMIRIVCESFGVMWDLNESTSQKKNQQKCTEK